MDTKLRRARLHAQLTQRQLARLAGVHYTLISLLENGKRSDAKYETKSAIAEALGVPVDALWPLPSARRQTLKRARAALLQEAREQTARAKAREQALARVR